MLGYCCKIYLLNYHNFPFVLFSILNTQKISRIEECMCNKTNIYIENRSECSKTGHYRQLNKIITTHFYFQFQDIIAKYLRRKYAANRNPYYNFCPDISTSLCVICKLPLKNDILSDCETVKDCGHKFHKFCFDRGDQICVLCE